MKRALSFLIVRSPTYCIPTILRLLYSFRCTNAPYFHQSSKVPSLVPSPPSRILITHLPTSQHIPVALTTVSTIPYLLLPSSLRLYTHYDWPSSFIPSRRTPRALLDETHRSRYTSSEEMKLSRPCSAAKKRGCAKPIKELSVTGVYYYGHRTLYRGQDNCSLPFRFL